MRRTAVAALTLAASTAALVAAPVAGATTYNNDTPIIIPAEGTTNPYPSSITVSGTAGPITDVNVGFDGFTHASPPDVSIVLVAPTGEALIMLQCVGGGDVPASGVFVTLDDVAPGHVPGTGTLTSGTFKPTSHCGGAGTPSFPAPGPLSTFSKPGPVGGTATFASTFNGLSPIGTWNLYGIDIQPADGGSIPGGWSLDVKPDVTPLPAATPTPTPAPLKRKCKKKKGKKAGATAKKCKRKPKKTK
jgi:hypothetical protein